MIDLTLENEEENESVYLFVSQRWSSGKKEPYGQIHFNNSNVQNRILLKNPR